jgi:hypothetical protein
VYSLCLVYLQIIFQQFLFLWVILQFYQYADYMLSINKMINVELTENDVERSSQGLI